jgi:MFS transporter, CP family, cyanate transporter
MLAAVLLVAVNLCGPIAAISPVLTDVKAGLHLSASAAGLLTTLPVLCFAAASALIGPLARWIGVNRAEPSSSVSPSRSVTSSSRSSSSRTSAATRRP